MKPKRKARVIWVCEHNGRLDYSHIYGRPIFIFKPATGWRNVKFREVVKKKARRK